MMGSRSAGPRGHEHGRASLATCLLCGGMGEGEMPYPPHPLPPAAGGRTGLGVMKAGELPCPSLAGCSTQETGPHTSPGSTVELALVEDDRMS